MADAHGGDLPPAHSFIAVDSAGVQVGSLKLGEEGAALVMRLWETTGEGTNALVRTGFALGGCADANLLEDARYDVPSEGDGLALHLGPYDIKTVMVKPGRRP
jgi:alpha-mannosidase